MRSGNTDEVVALDVRGREERAGEDDGKASLGAHGSMDCRAAAASASDTAAA